MTYAACSMQFSFSTGLPHFGAHWRRTAAEYLGLLSVNPALNCAPSIRRVVSQPEATLVRTGQSRRRRLALPTAGSSRGLLML